jgi:hypothetical protein
MLRRRGGCREVHGAFRRREVRSGAEREGAELDAVKNTRPTLATTTPIDNASGPSGRASIGDASEPASHCCDPP